MKKLIMLTVAFGMIGALGCAEEKQDPTKRPGFVDTSDPSKVKGTMQAPPKGKGDPTALGGKKP